MSKDKAQLRASFIELMAKSAERKGHTPISGRITGLLLFDGQPYSFSELATELGVSRGSISSNTRHLIEHGMIQRVEREGDRQDYFEISHSALQSMLGSLSEEMDRTASEVEHIIEALDGDDSGTRERLRGCAVFHRSVSEGIAHTLSRIREFNLLGCKKSD
ncbi:GbsR/MarR family transcriptional regulator [Marivivens aquimaris]|uniref:GbsR/MarR family transcriptional regulator n=1 Tax=Marivivens aquimaris TaxID=2774876 RepID=UPI00187F7B52|nr:MarR family transcriptional regulator [Marivivens aquimaris]